ncbi:helix-turn-helix domain-containing protein [Kitasatospora sp. GP82]|uniref:TetR/AcrR family transcriptional regulator n=1 Tax=Kitasatospora sp. GP82 TaxID=3035089 RepID=UPI0024758965|nr:helix-turn-helix domain-containing protein [Kitasatospora sp. GP82]MDH6129014.1 AcrR family transcriptional regulator [Kitasatospora sp. GP82]
MTDQERVLGHPVSSGAEGGTGGLGGAGLHGGGLHGSAPGPGALGGIGGIVPEQRGPGDHETYGTAAQSPHSTPGVSGTHGGCGGSAEDSPRGGGPARLRVDARRNLESVLRAAREVFGELGYDAPMEEVARRAGVGVGTVYRRFPSKEVLVQRIAAEEVAWLTAQARESLYGSAGPWEALAGYLARAVGSGAGRLLPPSAFRYAEELGTAGAPHVPEQRLPEHSAPEQFFAEQRFGQAGGGGFGGQSLGQPGHGRSGFAPQSLAEQGFGQRRIGEFGFPEPWVPEQRGSGAEAQPSTDADPRLLLHLLAALVARAGAAGELRPGVTVSDVVLVLTAAVPVHVIQGHPARGSEAVVGSVSGSGSGSGSGLGIGAGTGIGVGAGEGDGIHDRDGRAVAGLTDGSPADRLLQILLHGLRAR